ncbi:hypothetical protein SOPP22_15885 [Shewanella sp. OPT22]|nr:hypothetical protein SOPP22_15885 [Shewanella sp. OPT22]
MKHLLFILTLFSVNVVADDAQEFNNLVKPVFDSIEKGNFENIASTALSNGTVIKYISPASLEKTDGDFASLLKAFGKYYSNKLLHEQGIEGDYWARWYLMKFERQPVILYFEFYKPNDKWGINALEVKTDIDDKIEEAGDYKISVIGLNDKS